MGTKPSNNFQSNRPESGGANHNEQLEKSGILEREKQEFAAAQQAKGERPPREAVAAERLEEIMREHVGEQPGEAARERQGEGER